MKTESVDIEQLQTKILELKEKLYNSEKEVRRLGSLVDSLTREIDQMERAKYSDDDE